MRARRTMVAIMRSLHLASLGALLLAAAVLGSGCDVDPYCLTCGDAAMDAPMDAGVDAMRDAGPPRDVPTDEAEDAGPDSCLPAELCNQEDDDCDGLIDEGIDTDVDPMNCGGCGQVCAPPHSFPLCQDGECGISGCDVGWHDRNGDVSDGCEYRCQMTAEDDAICDLRDNDCDGMVDEDVDKDNDPDNCGSCGRLCAFAHVTNPRCEGGSCTFTAPDDCEADSEGNPIFWDLDEAPRNGCEYACELQDTNEDGAIDDADGELCNTVDDDCDGTIDEGDPEGGASCGTGDGECQVGTEQCVGGTLVCTGAVEPTTELCNGLDDDCDLSIDENDPEGGALCGISQGTCERGRLTCQGGELECVGAVGPGDEVCDGLDNDCDGSIDEENPGGGGTCGENTGTCEFGSLQCSGGVLVCTGGVGPEPELCDGLDNDCDGTPDDGNPQSGSLCGTDVGTCSPGTNDCVDGELVCMGNVGPGTESCDGLDNDCDSNIDENNPDGGGACGNTTGACTAGMFVCRSGTLVCEGGTLPSSESCNSADDDCDGSVDEDFDLLNDVNNCGMCGRRCSFDFGFADCQSGSCVMTGCEAGHHDLNDDDSDGCEHACEISGSEVCNGLDDDCDGTADNGLTPPSNFCNPNGVCANTTPTCTGTDGWVCNYGSTFRDNDSVCDDLDNDCDGFVDEEFPLKTDGCSFGQGVCRTTGQYICTAEGDGVECDADPAGTPTDEVCDNADNDCDGSVDERVPDDPGTAWRDGIDLSAIATVTVDRPGGGTMEVMQYEASRPDASSTAAGSASTFACSQGGVVPWTSVTWPEAQSACCALNSDGQCPGSGDVGWRLCSGSDFEAACTGPTDSCTWSYATSCDSSQRLVCNGEERDCDPGTDGDHDCLESAGASASCRTVWSGGSVYDLSGNAKEWTSTEPQADLFQIRGGSYTSVEEGRRCDFDFTVAGPTFSHPDTGFRCCYY